MGVYHVRIPRSEYSSSSSTPSTRSTTRAISSPADQQAKEEEQEDDLDEEGLSKSGYDVIICGTGLTQSILASALARAGKSVLQCDGNDYYGEMDAVLSLDQTMDWARDINKQQQSKQIGDTLNIIESHPGEEDNLQLADGEVVIDLDPAGGCTGLKIHSTSMDSTRANSDALLEVGVEVVTTLGEGRIVSLPTRTSPCLTVSLTQWTRTAEKNKPKPTAHFGYGPIHDLRRSDNNVDEISVELDPQSMTHYYKERHNIITKTSQLKQDVVDNWGRKFALDLTPGLIYATGDAVDGLVKSGVADYLEFKSAEAIYLLMEPGGDRSSRKQARGGGRTSRRAVTGKTKGDNSSGKDNAAASSEFQLSRVPCSKGDVFQTKLLSPVEKRRLMKFLQLASDYAIAVESAKAGGAAAPESATPEETEESKAIETTGDGDFVVEGSEQDNIQSLNERQLLQGRSLTRPQNKVVSTSDLDTLRDYVDRRVDFDEYLRTVHSLSDRLRRIAIHAMAMESAAATSSIGEQDRATSYPTGRAMTDLCRHLLSLGRYGGTAFLVPMHGSGELSQSFCRSAAVHGATYLLRRPAKGLISTQSKSGEGMEVTGIVLGGDVDPSGKSLPAKVIRAPRVVVPGEAMPSEEFGGAVSGQRILRRISVLSGKLITNNDDPNGNDATEQRHIIVIPPQTGKLGNTCVIHGIALDESVNVAPRSLAGDVTCTVLHLTTTVSCSEREEEYYTVLDRAAQSLIEAQGKSNVNELFHISFSYISHPTSGGSFAEQAPFQGLTVCRNGAQSITLEAVFHRAKQIFETVCPGADFLALSTKMDEMVRERTGGRGDDEDDEQVVLESAMDLIDTAATASADEDTATTPP